MAIYNTSFMETVTNPLDIIMGVSANLTNNSPYLFGYMFLSAFFLIFLITMFTYDIKKVIVIDSFLCCILAMLFAVASMLPFSAIIYPFIIFVIALIFYLFS